MKIHILKNLGLVKFLLALLAAVYIIAYIKFFDSFGLSLISINDRHLILTSFFIASFGSLLLVFLFDYLIVRLYENMNIWLRFLFFSMLGYFLLLLSFRLLQSHFSSEIIINSEFLNVLIDIISMILLPILIVFYLMIRSSIEKSMDEAAEIENNLSEFNENQDSNRFVVRDDNDQILFELEISELYFIQGSDNYSTIHYLKGKSVQKQLLRITLKSIEAQNSANGFVIRCHRSYIVNLNKVKRVKGNAQGYKFHLENDTAIIPVSRGFSKEIIRKIKSGRIS